jgi:pimeloyl-ACP methyl ester carboxylesterase
VTVTTVTVEDGARLCVEAIGEHDAPAVLLIGGSGASMDWWDDELCDELAAAGRRVVRYDHRDTGRSTTYARGAPGYTGADLAADAIAILDALRIDRAHLVGVSMGGGLAQRIALDHRDRVISLTLIATSAIERGDEELPGIAPRLREAFAAERPEPDWNDRDAVVEHLVETFRPYFGTATLDERRLRARAERVVDRSDDIATSLTNHDVLEEGEPTPHRLSDLTGVPTLVLHGTDDPLFPPAHGRALAKAIPGAKLVELEGMGHEVPPPDAWRLIVEHTG